MRNRSGYGWIEFIVGILQIALGILAFASPNTVMTGAVVIYGILAIIMGIVDIVLYVRIARYAGFGPYLSLISGILSVMAGIMLLVLPQIGVTVLTIIFPVWFIAHCISRLAQVDYLRRTVSSGLYYFSMVVNIIGIILGIMMFIRPLFTLTVISYLAGVYLILLGIESLVLAFSKVGRRI